MLDRLDKTTAGSTIVTLMSGACMLAFSGDDVDASKFAHYPSSLVVCESFTNGQSEIVQDAEIQFKFLIESWHEERGVSSSITDIAMCPSYQRIIAMGRSVIPLILRQLESEGDEPDMWFWALKVISGDDPVADKDRGNVIAMANAWLDWGQNQDVW